MNEFQTFTVPNDGRKLTELYNVQHMSKNAIDPVARVTISTVQRLYSTLKGEAELRPGARRCRNTVLSRRARAWRRQTGR